MTCGRVGGVVSSMDFSASAFQISMSLLPTLSSFFILWRALKAVLDVCLDVLGEEVAGVALDGGAVLPNQELLKVPRDVCPPHWFPNQEVGAEKSLRWSHFFHGWTRFPAHLAIRLSESSAGAGRDFLRKVKSGCSFSPFTSTWTENNFSFQSSVKGWSFQILKQ